MAEPVPSLPAPLRGLVTSVTAYDRTGAPGVHRGLPGTSLTLVLPVDDPIDVGWAGQPASRRRGWSSVAGLHAGPAAVHHGPRQSGIFLALSVSGARALLRRPAADLAGVLTDLDEVAPALATLPERLHGTTSWAERVRLVHAALVASLPEGTSGERPVRPEVRRALVRLAQGATPGPVADEVGFSRRHLRSLVRAETGLGPKEWQRLARFERSRDLLRGAAGSMAAVAARSGYADQAHLSREWGRLAGCPPTTWVREEVATRPTGSLTRS